MIITYKRLFYIMLFYYFVNNYIKTSNLLRYIRNSESVNAFIDISKEVDDSKKVDISKEVDDSKEVDISKKVDDNCSPKLDPELQIVDN